MSPSSSWSFPPFRLDPDTGSLWRQDTLVPLSPKPVAVLAVLVAQAGQVVPKAALLEAVWANTAVTEGVLKSCIRQIRQALGEGRGTVQYIATVHGRGYRFIAPVTLVSALAAAPAGPAAPPEALPPLPLPSRSPPLLVGRAAELAQVHQWWAQACQGTRQVVFITGEAGIGKTTLVETFVAQVQPTAPVWLGRGQCIEQHGAGEPYLPLLEALGRLGRGPDGGPLVAVLRQQAPSWLLQLPALVPEDAYAALQRRGGGVTRERMLRELAEAVEALTAERPMVLVVEDLHWSDAATVDWLTYVARRREAARLLVLGTYRPTDALVQGHPVHAAAQALQLRGQGHALSLGYFSAAAVATYLAQRCGTPQLPVGLVQALHQRTTGNPLFLVTVVETLVRQGQLPAGDTSGAGRGDLAMPLGDVPDSLRQLIEQQLAQCVPEVQTLLEAASVAGQEFAVAAVAAAVGQAVEVVEDRCVALARQGQFLRAGGPEVWPDGTVAERFGFRHDLYRETLYARVPGGRRVRWHRQIGRRLETGYGPRARERAAELAEHFLRGRDPERAVQYLRYAGENAQRRSAHQEAIGHFTTGLAVLTTLPDTPERARQELTLHLARGPALYVTRGDAAPEVEQTYVRAQALCQHYGESAQALQVLRGLWAVYHGRLQFRQARALGEQYLALAQQGHEPAALVEAHYALGTALFYLGEFARARVHFEQGVACYDLQREHFRVARQGEDPGVACRAFLVSTLGFLGYPDQARQRAEEARQLAQELAHPYSLAFARYRAGLYALFCRQAQVAQALAEEVLSLATTHGFPFYAALGTALRGGACVRQGQGEEGFALLRQGLTALSTTGTQPAPHWLVWQADLYGAVGQPAAGLRLLEEAMVQADTTGNYHAVAELHRLKGECGLALSAERTAEAEACFHRALAMARRQQAKALELRAAMSLCRLWHRQAKRAAAWHLLAEVYGWFAEGFDTADLQEAKALLEELGGGGGGGSPGLPC
jgi:predicted ATPase/DNA-binding winged helix-turn-helix (wHTH) protein